MKKTKNDAPAAGEAKATTEEQTAHAAVMPHEEPEEADPKDQLAELEAIFSRREEKLTRLRDLEALKAKYVQEIEDFKIDPLAEDAPARMNIRKSRENMIEMIDIDIWKINDTPDKDEARAQVLVNDLAQSVRQACDRDTSALVADIRAFIKANPAVSFLFDDQELPDDQIRNLPWFRRATRIVALSDNFNLLWRVWDAARLAEEAPKFFDLVGRAVKGDRILVLPEA